MTPPRTQWAWRKARESAQETNCVEIGFDSHGHAKGLRDSKNPDGPALTGLNIRAFVRSVAK